MEVKNFIMKLKKPEIRFLYDLKSVVYDKKWLKSAQNAPLYYIYRGVKEKNNIRYDITIIPPRLLGKEFVKTKGHYHSGSYGELYKVISGEGIFLVQKKNIKDIYFVRAKRGEYILIPPYYGHTILNPSPKTEFPSLEKGTKVKKRTKSSSTTLKIANWVSKDMQSDYKSIERKRGFCYYYTVSGWLKNKVYKKIPKLRFKRPLKEMPKNLDFLYGKSK